MFCEFRVGWDPLRQMEWWSLREKGIEGGRGGGGGGRSDESGIVQLGSAAKEEGWSSL